MITIFFVWYNSIPDIDSRFITIVYSNQQNLPWQPNKLLTAHDMRYFQVLKKKKKI